MAKSASPTAAVPATLNGVLVLRGADGHARGYTISAAPAPAPPAKTGLTGWWQALVFAFLGGLILNLMPCVFPILSLKVLEPRRRRSGETTPSRARLRAGRGAELCRAGRRADRSARRRRGGRLGVPAAIAGWSSACSPI